MRIATAHHDRCLRPKAVGKTCLKNRYYLDEAIAKKQESANQIAKGFVGK